MVWLECIAGKSAEEIFDKFVERFLLEEGCRAEELATVRSMKVWTKAAREECLRVTGKPPIKLRWVDVNKGDDKDPKYRSRIVAKEIRKDVRPELFAATPPIEYIK